MLWYLSFFLNFNSFLCLYLFHFLYLIKLNIFKLFIFISGYSLLTLFLLYNKEDVLFYSMFFILYMFFFIILKVSLFSLFSLSTLGLTSFHLSNFFLLFICCLFVVYVVLFYMVVFIFYLNNLKTLKNIQTSFKLKIQFFFLRNDWL